MMKGYLFEVETRDVPFFFFFTLLVYKIIILVYNKHSWENLDTNDTDTTIEYIFFIFGYGFGLVWIG